MTYDPITSFRRPFELCSSVAESIYAPSLPPEGVSKWDILREVGVARTRLGLSDRAVSVLQALLSFHGETMLKEGDAPLIVFPSNAAICERLNGMASSTMRRHLACLLAAGLLARRDSPNGKRFCRRYQQESEAFGFDLRPLLARFPEICGLAAELRSKIETHERLRRTVSLMRRDLAGLAEYGCETGEAGPWDRLSDMAALAGRALRRKLTLEDLDALREELAEGLAEARHVLMSETVDMSTKDANSEHHHQTSNIDISDSEPCLEKQGETAEIALSGKAERGGEEAPGAETPTLPLRLVLSACGEVQGFSEAPVKTWQDLFREMARLTPMMGISRSAWHDAIEAMGPCDAATVTAAMLERTADIKNPGGYLRALTAKARAGAFSPGPMVMALINRAA